MPAAGKDVECPLCRDLAKHGTPMTKAASNVLNNQPAKPASRTCPGCKQEVAHLVTRQDVLICTGCAEELDDQ